MVEPLSARDDFLRGVADERERCALLAETLAARWEASGARLRDEGTYYVRALWPPFKRVKCVTPRREQAAKDIEAAAHGLRTIAQGCREGWDPRKIEPHEEGMALRTGVDGDPSLVKLDPSV